MTSKAHKDLKFEMQIPGQTKAICFLWSLDCAYKRRGGGGSLEIAQSQIVGLFKDTVNTNQVDDVDLLEKDYDDKEDIFEHVSTC